LAESWSNLYTRIPAELREKLDAYCKKTGDPIIKAVTQALEEKLKK